MTKGKIIAWWSGGVTSAITCKICIDLYGIENVRVIFIDTKNEDEDTYRFLTDCEKWYGEAIETITSDKWDTIQDVWRKRQSLNVAHGAICSSELKRRVREKWQKNNTWRHQAFGFDLSETKRALSMSLNNPDVKPIFPLMLHAIDKKQCIKMISEAGIEVPRMYKLGFQNNNCFGTGCVQGGIGYWKKMQSDYGDKFDKMAAMEHELTDKKGKPVTMLKDQGKSKGLVFLKKHPDYPLIKCLNDMKGVPVKPLMECNGFCGTNDLEDRSPTEMELNFDIDN